MEFNTYSDAYAYLKTRGIDVVRGNEMIRAGLIRIKNP